jgi:DNA polymerase V
MFALVDCNNFYVSCERVFNPSLNDKPVVVLSNNDGCIISRSNEAKKLGIKMAEAAFKITDFLQMNNVVVFSSNYDILTLTKPLNEGLMDAYTISKLITSEVLIEMFLQSNNLMITRN